MIGLVTDSNSQMPQELRARYGIEVVPIVVVVDGVEYLEGVDLDADSFYTFFTEERTPEVSTSQPSPAAFLAAYERLADGGADRILSIHVTGAMSGTLNSARLAAAEFDLPVEVVDSGTGSFGVSCCVWAAAEALRAGASIGRAASVAAELGAAIESTFIVQALDFAHGGGRLTIAGETARSAQVLATKGSDLAVIGEGHEVDELCDIMAAHMLRGGEPIRAAVSVADAAGEPFRLGLEERLVADPLVMDVVRYRVGPSVGAHTGPGTAGGFFYPFSDPSG